MQPDRPYRILVTGSRDWDDVGRLSFHLGLAAGQGLAVGRPVTVVHGACPRGADRLADRVARAYPGITVEPHPADWEHYGRGAGFRRNHDMVVLGADVCLAFIKDNSRGASHCAALAEQAGIHVRRVEARS
jgi:hypothetical protein